MAAGRCQNSPAGRLWVRGASQPRVVSGCFDNWRLCQETPLVIFLLIQGLTKIRTYGGIISVRCVATLRRRIRVVAAGAGGAGGERRSGNENEDGGWRTENGTRQKMVSSAEVVALPRCNSHKSCSAKKIHARKAFLINSNQG